MRPICDNSVNVDLGILTLIFIKRVLNPSIAVILVRVPIFVPIPRGQVLVSIT